MLFELIAFGALWTYGLLLVPLAFLLVFAGRENGTAATMTVIITAIAVTLFSNFNVAGWLLANWTSVLLYGFGYVAAGMLWSRVKWGHYLHHADSVYNSLRTAFFTEKGLSLTTKLSDLQKRELHKYVGSNNTSNIRNFPPQVSREKARITSWIAYWPFSIVGFFVADVICNFANTVYVWMSGYYQRLSNARFAKYSELAD